MKTSVSKTELIYFSRKPLLDPLHILVKWTDICHYNSIKILGVKFQKDLGWDAYFCNFAKPRYLSCLVD